MLEVTGREFTRLHYAPPQMNRNGCREFSPRQKIFGRALTIVSSNGLIIMLSGLFQKTFSDNGFQNEIEQKITVTREKKISPHHDLDDGWILPHQAVDDRPPDPEFSFDHGPQGREFPEGLESLQCGIIGQETTIRDV